jgi:hypothetical protein
MPAVLITKRRKMEERKNISILIHQLVMFAKRNQDTVQVAGLMGLQQNIMFVRIYPHVTNYFFYH